MPRMTITPHIVAGQIEAYLRGQLSLEALVDWAERQIMDGQFDSANSGDADRTRDVVARLGVADVRAFGLSWEDCQQLLQQLGYHADVRVMAT